MTPGGRMAHERRIARSFYDRPADHVAPDLIGKLLCVRDDDAVHRARIVETEAYVGVDDLACHASKGRTARTEVIFGPPGHAYVYFVYGMHHLLNVVCHKEGEAHAVLIRGAEPVSEMDGRLDGPARLTKTLGITTPTHNRLDLLGDRIWIEDDGARLPHATDVRIGVDYAKEWVHAPLRFLVPGSPGVSVPPRQT